MIRSILFILLIIAAVLMQVSFFNEFVSVRNSTNLILIMLVAVSTLIGYRQGLFFGLVAGLAMDIFSPFSFGLITFSMVVSVLIIFLLFRKLLARKTIYTIITAMFVTTISYNLIFWLIINIVNRLGWHGLTLNFSSQYLLFIVYQLITHTLVISLIFILVRYLNKKIRTSFFISEKI